MLNCEARTESFKSATSEDPLADLIGEWGYTGLLPENAVRWQRLPNYVHYVIGGLIIFMGKSPLIRALYSTNPDTKIYYSCSLFFKPGSYP